ncbi:MAG: hypothetical protein R3E32_05490 [Chitinophagales bacterium]
MITLRKTFKYEGNINTSPINNVVLEVSTPVFSFSKKNRNIVDYKKTEVKQNLNNRTYRIDLPIDFFLIESTKLNLTNFYKFNLHALSEKSNIDDYTFKIYTNVNDSFGNILRYMEGEALIVLKNNKKISNSFINNDFLLLNALIIKKLYNQIIAIDPSHSSLSKQNLINIINNISVQRGANIKITENKNVIDYIKDGLSKLNIKTPEKIISVIERDFNNLFDFPIFVPEIKRLEVAGNFIVISNSNITKEHFDFYKLSIEYSQKNSEIVLLSNDWSSSTFDLDNKTAEFSFTSMGRPISINNIVGLIRVKVKGFLGNTLWFKEFDSDDKNLQNLTIKVPLNLPEQIDNFSGIGKPNIMKKLRGQIVHMGIKNRSLKDITVIVQAKENENQNWIIIGSAKTDNSGNFTLDYPFGKYTQAQITSSLTPESPVAIQVDATNQNNQIISDNFLYLLITDENIISNNGDNEGDCGCNSLSSNTTAKRLPDDTDLIESDEYTQDIGGSCLNLTTPNRTLREYNYNAIVRTSDPDVAKYVLQKNDDGGKVVFKLEGVGKTLDRKTIGINNPIRWQDAPDAQKNLSLYQAVTIATGHILHYKTIFKADGYSLGDLLYSLPLAPGQKKQIVVFDSNHSFTGAESQSISQDEELDAELTNDRFITDFISGGVNEDLSGDSSASTSGIGAGLGAGVSYQGIGANLGVAGGVANSHSSASQNSSRNISQYFNEVLRQSIRQNSESFRKLNASVITTAKENQNYSATTEVVANHNHCHSLTMMYFEVLRHYAIYQELTSVEECVFVPLLMTNFTTENIHKWKDVLAQHLLPIHSNTYLYRPFLKRRSRYNYRRHPLLKAFDANERIKTNYERVDYPAEGESYADGEIEQIKGYFIMNINIPRPKTKYDRILSLPLAKKIETHREVDMIGTLDQGAWNVLKGLFGGGIVKYKNIEEEVYYTQKIFDAFMHLDPNYDRVPPAKCIRIMDFEPIRVPVEDSSGNTVNITTTGLNFFEDDMISEKLWTSYSKILRFDSVFKLLNAYFKGRLIAEWDTIFYQELLPDIFKEIVDSISIDTFNLDFSTNARYAGRNRRISVTFNSTGSDSRKRSELPLYIKIKSTNPDIIELKGHIKLNVVKTSINYTTAHFNGILYRGGYISDDLLDEVSLYIPQNSRDKKNPRKEDRYLVNTLLEHLNGNLEYYNKLLWRKLDRDRRYMLLDGFQIQIFNSFGNPIGYRSIASVVKNRLITIAGNSLVFPVAAGYKVSQSYITEKIGENVVQEISLFDHYKPLTPPQPYRISVPSKGVFMEAIQGACDACENVKENSSQDWEKFRADEPTPIAQIIPPTPTITDYKPTYKDFAPPLVSIQNAPNTPAPAEGLAALSDLLKNSSFKDITGLSQNQLNALETLKKSLETAKDFGEQASGLAKLTVGLDAIEKGKKSGVLSNEQAKEMAKKLADETLPKSDNERRENTKKDIELIEEMKEKGAIDSEKAKELNEAIVKKDKGITTATPETPKQDIFDLCIESHFNYTLPDNTIIDKWTNLESNQGIFIMDGFNIRKYTLTARHLQLLNDFKKYLIENGGKILAIIGRASNTSYNYKGKDGNLPLSVCRAAKVADFLDVDSEIVYGFGDKKPYRNLRGEQAFERNVTIVYSLPFPSPSTLPTPPGKNNTTGSKKWEILTYYTITGDIPVPEFPLLGIGVGYIMGELKDATSGEQKRFAITLGLANLGTAGGLNITTPVNAGSFSSFDTDRNYTFEDFDGTLATLTGIVAGLITAYSSITIRLLNSEGKITEFEMSGFEIGMIKDILLTAQVGYFFLLDD